MFEDLEKFLLEKYNKDLEKREFKPNIVTDFIAKMVMKSAIAKAIEDLETEDKESGNQTKSDNWTGFRYPLPSEDMAAFQKLGMAFADLCPPKKVIIGCDSSEDGENEEETEDHRRDILEGAIQCVCSDRESQYGSPERSFDQIATFWSGYLGYEITPHDVGVMMALMKIARIKTGRFKQDSYVDACGYLACAGEIAEKNEE